MPRIALAQMRIDYTDTMANIKIGMSMINSAIKSKCNMIVLPELWSTGFQLQNRLKFSEVNLGLIQDLHRISTEENIEIIGSYISKNCGYHNDFIAIQPNSLEFHYAKIHLFPTLHEPDFLEPGKKICVYPSVLGQSGASICFDLRFPDHFQQLSKRGASFHILPAHWPRERINHWDILLKARAIETLSFMIAVNSTGTSGKLKLGGHSSIISPDGELLLQATTDAEGVFISDIDESLIKTTRDRFHFLPR